MNKIFIRGTYVPFFLLFVMLTGCDFTPKARVDLISAQELISKNQYDLAINKLEKVILEVQSKEIKISSAYQLGELIMIHTKNYARALECFNMVISESNDPLWVVKSEENIASIYFDYLKNFNKSIESYTKLIQFVPKLKNYDLYEIRIAISKFYAGNLVEAEEYLNEIIVKNTSSYAKEAYFYLGLLQFEQKKWDKSIETWQSYLKLETKEAEKIKVKFLIANAYESNDKLKEAYKAYKSLLDVFPNKDVIKSRMAQIYERKLERRR